MVERRARIAGCELHVACMGAVATRETHRGRGFASRLVQAAFDKARADGADLMLISGDRTLYRRAGAVPVGLDYRCVADAGIAERLHDPRVRVRRAVKGDLAACAAAYDMKPARFVRPMREWTDRIGSNAAAEGWHHLLIVEEKGAFRGYVALNRGSDWGHGEVAEFGGAPEAVSGALLSVSALAGETSLKMTLQGHDSALREYLTVAGAAFAPVSVDGAWAIVGFTRLVERLGPWVEQRAGSDARRSLACSESEDACTLSMSGRTVTLSRAEAVVMIFGAIGGAAPPPPFCDVFPLPTVAYGIGYV
jgi:ribosomal protein S18 acetylase RimI-like enzyme